LRIVNSPLAGIIATIPLRVPSLAAARQAAVPVEVPPADLEAVAEDRASAPVVIDG
jgi:hypothetical protein